MSQHLAPRSVARLAALLAALLLLASTAAAAAGKTTPPRKALFEAQARLHHSTSAAARTALGDLKAATDKPLWISPSEADAPAYGTTVFTDTGQAVTRLEALLLSPQPGPAAATRLILDADRALAATVIAEAAGGNQKLLHSAQRKLHTGNDDAGKGNARLAAGAYEASWKFAYQALTALVVAQTTSVPASDVAAAAENALGSKKIGLAGPSPIANQSPLTEGGKPEVFFAGAEGCPFCGVERWGMIVALAQFGKFSGLHLMQSADVLPPNVRTFTFFGSTFSSPYIAFEPDEVTSNVRKRFKFVPLQKPTPAEQTLLDTFDPPGITPFIDVANRFTNLDSTVKPPLIKKMSWTEVAASLRHPSSGSAQAISGTAEVLTAEICEATAGNPKTVCGAPIVAQYQAALSSLNGHGGGCPTVGTSAATARADRRTRAPQAHAARCHT